MRCKPTRILKDSKKNWRRVRDLSDVPSQLDQAGGRHLTDQLQQKVHYSNPGHNSISFCSASHYNKSFHFRNYDMIFEVIYFWCMLASFFYVVILDICAYKYAIVTYLTFILGSIYFTSEKCKVVISNATRAAIWIPESWFYSEKSTW